MSRRFVFLTAAVLSIAAFSVPAQKARPDFNRFSDYDVQHYTIRASFDRMKKQVFGDTTVTLKPAKSDLRSVELDAVGLNFSSVKLENGAALTFKTTPTKVVVTLDKAYQPADTISIRFKYSTTSPKKGVYFVNGEKDDHGNMVWPDQIWSQGEAEEARYWFPSFDFPSDKATTEEYITAQRDETVIGNGELLGKDEKPDGTTTWHYKMPVPHSTYLVSFVIGKYIRVGDKYKDIPLGFYVYPGREETARKAFGNTKDMIAVYEKLTGVPFPYNKYDQTIVARFQFGGMENITATTMADTEISMADMGLSGIVTDLVSHELAHSWFGDMVTCKNWAELWLNEGWATYMEAAYREQAFGRDDYMAKVREDAAEFLVGMAINKKPHPLYDLNARNVEGLFDDASITYHKGGAVLHQLREQVGTDAFWNGVNIYLNRHKFGNVEATDLRKAMEEVSGQDLGWFFDQWVYSAGAPSITVTQSWRARTKTLTVTIAQTQKPDTITPAAFRLPLDVEIHTTAGAENHKVDVTKRMQSFTFKLRAKPSKLVIDPADKIVIKKMNMRPLVITRGGGED
ncbi:MAG TPA: M1 family metallopeptidase [Pyrinomonadaceae bacterium]|nr:M1 family metallopeptidase [Pyrinomonadaceae bacterium]